jgi:hypothetical protein
VVCGSVLSVGSGSCALNGIVADGTHALNRGRSDACTLAAPIHVHGETKCPMLLLLHRARVHVPASLAYERPCRKCRAMDQSCSSALATIVCSCSALQRTSLAPSKPRS